MAESRFRRLPIVGLALLIVGAVLFGTAVVGSASPGTGESGCRNSLCSLSVSPDVPFANASPAQVTGQHFSTRARGVVVECNMDPSAPTIVIPGRKPKLGPLSVGCSFYHRTPAKVPGRGRFFAGLTVTTGVVGPPATGTDSAGGSAQYDAADYPCPPTEAQVDAGVSCALVFADQKNATHESAYFDISFTTPYTTTTTTTTTTTNPGCPEVPTSVTSGDASVTVTPATCLQGGTPLRVTGSGLNRGELGSVMECNTAVGQPTAWNTLAGAAIPVGCTDPGNSIFSTTSAGTISPPAPLAGETETGTVGPPFTAGKDEGTPPADTPPQDLPTDSNAQAVVDAPEYPCPPTPAQVSGGDTCAIVVTVLAPTGGTVNQLVVPITFDPNNVPGGTARS